MKHTCKAPGCTQQIPAALLMCPRHWAQVPRNIQIRVTGAWRALARSTDSEHHAAWRAAAEEAIAAVTPKKVKPLSVGHSEQSGINNTGRARRETAPLSGGAAPLSPSA